MSSKWIGLDRHITTAIAEAEPEHDRLFGSSYEQRQRRLAQRGQRETTINRGPWRGVRKPRIIRAQQQGGLDENDESRRRRKAATQ